MPTSDVCVAEVSLRDVARHVYKSSYPYVRFRHHSGPNMGFNFLPNNSHPGGQDSQYRNIRFDGDVGFWYDTKENEGIEDKFDNAYDGLEERSSFRARRINRPNYDILRSLNSAFLFILAHRDSIRTKKDVINILKDMFNSSLNGDDALGAAAAGYVMLTRPDLTFTGSDFFGPEYSRWLTTFRSVTPDSISKLPYYSQSTRRDLLNLVDAMVADINAGVSLESLADSYATKRKFFPQSATPQIDAVASVITMLAYGLSDNVRIPMPVITVRADSLCLPQNPGPLELFLAAGVLSDTNFLCSFDKRNYDTRQSIEEKAIKAAGLAVPDKYKSVLCSSSVKILNVANNMFSVARSFTGFRLNMYYPINFYPHEYDWSYYSIEQAGYSNFNPPTRNSDFRKNAKENAITADMYLKSPKILASGLTLSVDFTVAAVLDGLRFIADEILRSSDSAAVKEANIARVMMMDFSFMKLRNYLFPASGSSDGSEISPVFPERVVGLVAAAYSLLFSPANISKLASEIAADNKTAFSPDAYPVALGAFDFVRTFTKDGTVNSIKNSTTFIGLNPITVLAIKFSWALLNKFDSKDLNIPKFDVLKGSGIPDTDDGMSMMRALCQVDYADFLCKSREDQAIAAARAAAPITPIQPKEEEEPEEEEKKEEPPAAATASSSSVMPLLLGLGAVGLLFLVFRNKKK